METKKIIYTAYCETTDTTIIFEDVQNIETGDILSTEVKGFYFGEPKDEANKQYYGKLKAEF